MKQTDSYDYIREQLQHFTSRNYKLKPETIDALAAAATVAEIPKGDSFSRQGMQDTRFTLITKGLFRMYHVFDGIDMTIAFARPGDPFMSVSTYLTGQVAEFTLEALEDSEIISLPNSRFKELCTTTDLNEWFHMALLGQIYALEQRYVWLGNLDAYSRYTKLIELRSDIINRVPLKYIASYLGITQETLSRIRAKYARTSHQ